VICLELGAATEKITLLAALSDVRKMGSAYSVVWLNEGVVHGDDLDIVVLDTALLLAGELMPLFLMMRNVRIAEDDATDTTKTVDTDLREAVNGCYKL
jgi:hypothetical protein